MERVALGVSVLSAFGRTEQIRLFPAVSGGYPVFLLLQVRLRAPGLEQRETDNTGHGQTLPDACLETLLGPSWENYTTATTTAATANADYADERG